MSRPGWFLLALLLPVALATASEHDNYASQWPLVLSSDDAGAYQVTLDASVYRQIQDPGLADVAVLDVDGLPVPLSVMSPGTPTLQSRMVNVPWFPLPMPNRAGADNGHAWELVREVESDGSLRRLAARVLDQSKPDAPPRALLVDLGQQRSAVTALELEWRSAGALDLAYRVEASEDLDHWQSLPVRARLVDLRRDGQRLLQRRIELAEVVPAGTQQRYLRLLPEDPARAPEVLGVRAQLVLPVPVDAPEWVELHGSPVRENGKTIIEYHLDGRFPIQQLDVALPGNHAVHWRLESRDDASLPWRMRAGPWMSYRVDADGRGDRSAPQTLAAPVRDRFWRLTTPTPVQSKPILRLGYRPETLVFLPAHAGPLILVAGSARPSADVTPVWQLVAALRSQHGSDWQPAAAELGPPAVLAGEAALKPRRDWTSWVLWGVLVLGALVVAGLAIKVLRTLPPTSP